MDAHNRGMRGSKWSVLGTDQRIHWIGHRGEGPSHTGQLRTVCILS
jgi:hypothetical protein